MEVQVLSRAPYFYEIIMRLENPELLASSLEDALGEYHWVSKNTDPHMRLRDVGVCGLVSAAIAENIDGATLKLSRPKITRDPTMRHLVASVPHEGEDVIIDASYTQFLVYAGLTPGYIVYGGADTFPEQKIATFKLGEHHETVLQLARHARIAIDTYERPADKYYNPNGGIFKQYSDEAIIHEYNKIWLPSNLEDFSVPTGETAKVRAIAARIPAEALRIVE